MRSDRLTNPAVAAGGLVALTAAALLGLGLVLGRGRRKPKGPSFPVLVQDGTIVQDDATISYGIYRFATGKYYWTARRNGQSAGKGPFDTKEAAFSNLRSHTW